jgi:hypothetical protein
MSGFTTLTSLRRTSRAVRGPGRWPRRARYILATAHVAFEPEGDTQVLFVAVGASQCPTQRLFSMTVCVALRIALAPRPRPLYARCLAKLLAQASDLFGRGLLLERGPQFGTARLQVGPEAWVLAPEAAAGVALAAAALLGGLAGGPFAGTLERALEALRLRPVANRAVGDPERRGGRDLGLAAGPASRRQRLAARGAGRGQGAGRLRPWQPRPPPWQPPAARPPRACRG